MKKIFIITAACLIVFGLSNCKKVLDQQDISTFTADQVFNDSTTAKLNIDYLYSQNQPGWFGNTGGSIHAAGTYNLTEEGQGSNNFVLGTVTIENVTDIGVANTTSNAYGKIRTINTFIRDINAGTLDAGVKRRFAAQAYFWRAYRYFELVKLYGGVPLVLVPLDAVGDQAKKDALVPRSKTSEVFAQIKKDLDSSVKYLPGKWPKKADYGRIVSVELKAITKLEDVHFAQAINYLEAYNLEIGLLINFGEISLNFKRFTNKKYKRSQPYFFLIFWLT